jgi:four helix bundle protein
MLRIQGFALDTVQSLAPAVKEITAQDPDLGRQLRRAASSIVLNIAEGSGPRNGNSRLRFRSAFGSTKETMAALELAAAWGYVERDGAALGALDRIAATLYRLGR